MYGLTEYGDKSAQAFDGHRKTGIEVETLRQYMRVSESITLGRRRPSVSFGHHHAVAGLKDEVLQDELLKRAENENLSRQDRQSSRRATIGGKCIT
jgi:hypothetical protein